jgi:hypothetical protein
MSRDSTLFWKRWARDGGIIEGEMDFLLGSSNIIDCI